MARLTVEERIKAVESSWQIGVTEAAKIYKISTRTLKRYRADIADLKNAENRTSKKICKKQPDGREATLLQFIQEQRSNSFAVTGTTLAYQILLHNPDIKNFKSTRQWAYRVLRKNSYVLRARTRQSQSIPSNYESLHAQFLLDYEAIMTDFQPELVINMDETSVSFDNSQKRTYEIKGSKTIAVRGFKGSRKACTCVFAVTQDGQKLKPFVIFNGKPQGRIKKQLLKKVGFPDHAEYSCNLNHWMTRETMHEWITRILKPFVGNRRFLLVLDAFTVHKERSVVAQLNAMPNCRLLYIPSGLTSMAQPLDISVNKPVKDDLRTIQSMDQSMGLVENSRENLAHKIVTVWNGINEETIRNGFIKSGLK